MKGLTWALFFAAFAALIGGCASLPPLEGRSETTALADTASTRLGRGVAADVAAHPGKSGIHAVPDPRDAFAARVVLASVAEKTLDVQYYIWHDDQVGNLMFEALWQAAERGVRVRLLLDDMNTKGLDPSIAAMDSHPNIEVRLYNPLVQRDARVLNFMTDFTRVNHRMHNKSFTIDNQVAVVGGRNIGNEYFALGGGVAFSDLDVVGIGDVVREVSREFDTYWNSPSAYPAAPFVGASGPEGVAKLKAAFAAARTDPESVVYLNAVRATAMLTNLVNRTLDFEWTTAKVLHDDPAKTLDTTARTDVLLLPQLMRMMGPADRNLDMISPYFVPGEGGTAALVAAAGRGVQIRILTNSLSSTDESAVHAGYAKRRVDLLRAGVKLYEMKATQTRESREETSGVGSSGSVGLHAKTLQVNGERIFVGSFNLDQRSAKLNTEMGIVIDSPTLAQRLARAFDNVVPQAAYEVRLKPDGQSVQWIERTASGETAHDTEPATSWSQRSKIEMLSVLPIEWLL